MLAQTDGAVFQVHSGGAVCQVHDDRQSAPLTEQVQHFQLWLHHIVLGTDVIESAMDNHLQIVWVPRVEIKVQRFLLAGAEFHPFKGAPCGHLSDL